MNAATAGWLVLVCTELLGQHSDPPGNPPGTAAAANRPQAVKPGGAPLFTDLGDYHHPIQTRSARAQAYFNQGLTLIYAFNHAEAERSFREAARLDPKCAMAYWGIAHCLGPNINKPMTDDAAEQAYQALQQALACLQDASPLERDLIAALAQRYAPTLPNDRASLDAAYAAAMRKVAADHPDDLDAATLCADAIMNTMPWKYWEKDGRPKPETLEVIRLLEGVLARRPDHPGANHLYIHAVEAGPNPGLGVAAADRLGSLCPGAGHLVHMPSHIYLRVGRYRDANEANVAAIAADKSYLEQCHAQGFYPAAYVSHNVHFMWYTRMMEGQSKLAIEAAKEVGKHLTPEAIRDFPELHGLLAVPLYVYLRFGMWEDVLAWPVLPGDTRFGRGIRLYADGVALARLGRLNEAREKAKQLEAFVDKADTKALDTQQFPGYQLLLIANHLVAAAVAEAAGEQADRIERLRQAVTLQDNLPYMEPPYWYFPVRQALGQALLDARNPAAAADVYRADLAQYPRNGWSLFGLSQSLEAQGKKSESVEALDQFTEAWQRADVTLKRSDF